jgi:hypothetical protein
MFWENFSHLGNLFSYNKTHILLEIYNSYIPPALFERAFVLSDCNDVRRRTNTTKEEKYVNI